MGFIFLGGNLAFFRFCVWNSFRMIQSDRSKVSNNIMVDSVDNRRGLKLDCGVEDNFLNQKT